MVISSIAEAEEPLNHLKPTAELANITTKITPETYSGVAVVIMAKVDKLRSVREPSLIPANIPMMSAIGVLAGMREGSRTDRSLSTFAIITTATPEYVSGVIFVVIFASSAVGLRWFKGSSASAMDEITIANFSLPVMTMAFYGMGYIARMTRASMAEVMTAQYIRTARLKGVSFRSIVLKHALRNALIAPFTVIMLQIPWLLTGVVIVETLFNYKGFGWLLVQAASNNDIDLLLACSMVAVFVVLITQLISDIGYVFLNPRIRIN